MPHFRRLPPFLYALCILAALLCSVSAERLRVIVETDAGGDPDDEQSLVRFLLYSSEWDVEGIIANRETAREGENKNRERTGLGIVRQQLDAYEQCYSNLISHNTNFPTPALLRARTVAGYASRHEGVTRIMEAVDAADSRPVWFMNWGTDHGSSPSCLLRALDKVRHERGEAGYAKFKAKLRLSSSDKFGDHTTIIEPPFPLWVDTFRPPINGKRWYHQFSALTAKAGGFDLLRDVLNDHGPLGSLYPTNTTHWQKEGDTMTFLYLVPTGMNDPSQPGWGSWGGRYGKQDGAGERPYFWANQIDVWKGSTNRDNTLLRWAADLQNDFAARLDWCVKAFAQANHPPKVVLNGDRTTQILRLRALPGTRHDFSAQGSIDPDGHPLSYTWHIYKEAGTYSNEVTVAGGSSEKASVLIPTDAAGKEIYVILTVRDNGSPQLAAYRRAILQIDEAP